MALRLSEGLGRNRWRGTVETADSWRQCILEVPLRHNDRMLIHVRFSVTTPSVKTRDLYPSLSRKILLTYGVQHHEDDFKVCCCAWRDRALCHGGFGKASAVPMRARPQRMGCDLHLLLVAERQPALGELRLGQVGARLRHPVKATSACAAIGRFGSATDG